MKVIKNINNNVSLCLDGNNNEVVVFGAGIGFAKPPYEVPLSKVEKTYYNIDPVYISMIHDIPEEVLDISAKVVDYARSRLENPISSNIVFTLADHINFAIQRYEKNLNITLPIIHDIQYLYEVEMDIGLKAVELIKKKMKIYLPKEEASYIAWHIINAESMNQNHKGLDKDHIGEITHIIEKFFDINIDKEGFNYSRFVTYMHFLFKRGKNNETLYSDNLRLFDSLKEQCPETYACSQQVCRYFENVLNTALSKEEKIDLMLHINRLCARESCCQ